MRYEAKIFGEVPAKANHYQIVSRNGKTPRIIKDDVIRKYEVLFVRQIKETRGVPSVPICVPFSIDVVVCYANARHDLDNSLKTLLDCIQMAGIIKDDVLCKEIRARKIVAEYNPYVYFSIDYVPENVIEFE